MVLMVLPLIGSVSVSEVLVIPAGLRRLPGPTPLPIIGNVLEIGRRPYLSLTAMSKRYGDVFQIQIGTRPVIVLSGIETVRQALVKQGEEFSSRPDLYSFRFINEGKSLSFSTDQAGVWRARRKLAYNALRSFSTLLSLTSSSLLPTSSVECASGRRYDHDDQELVSLVNLSNEFGQSGEQRLSMNTTQPSIRKLDENSNIQVSDEKIVGIVNDLFGAGSLRRLYQELKSNVIRNRKPRLSDKPNLPLLEAFILELFRHSSFPHFQRHVSNGYFIPKDTCVFINQWQINHDPEQWEDPSSFNPDRFLSADGTEVNKAEGEKVTTFGMGKRRCIGEIIARNEVYLFLTVDMTPEYGLTMKHKDCRLKARMRTRDEQ
uniref:unspecific monooxygenase n=1 Tax=Takifugu rubripes TaxID=31033 RepID=A0A674MFW6_TAKRU